MVNQNQLAKTCVACGLPKQLSAFLQISGHQGTTYGNICAACRGSGLNKLVVVPQDDADEQGSSSTGLRIDAKTKIHIESENKQATQQRKDSDQEDDKKRQLITDEKDERTETKEVTERKHREEYIEPKKKSSFLNYQRQKPITREPGGLAPESDLTITQATVQIAATEIQRQQEVTAEEDKTKGFNLSDTNIDPHQTGELKFQVGKFNKIKKIKTWLGEAGGTAYNSQFLAKKRAPVTTEKSALNKENVEKDPLVKYIQENWEPISPKPPNSRRR